MKCILFIFVAFCIWQSISATPCEAGKNILGGLGGLGGALSGLLGGLGARGKGNGQTQINRGGVGNRAVQDNRSAQSSHGGQERGEKGSRGGNGNNASQISESVNDVASGLDEIFQLILETTNSVANTVEVSQAVTAVADDSYAIVAILSNVKDDTLDDYNRFCEVTAILEAAVEHLVNLVNGVVSAVSSIVNNLCENDILTVKWVIEANVAVSGNIINSVSSVLEHSVEVTSEQSETFDPSGSFHGLADALSGITSTSTDILGSLTGTVSGIITALDLQSTLENVTGTVSSITGGLKDVTAILGQVTGNLGGAIGGIVGGLGGILGGVTNVVGGLSGSLTGLLDLSVLGSLNVGGVISNLTSQVSGVTKILSSVTLNIVQIVTVVVNVVENVSFISSGLTGILDTLGSIGNLGGSLKILPCKC